jgi:hypothetical protein
MRKFWPGLALLAISSLAAADEKDDVAKAAKKSTGLGSYAFKITIELEGGPMGGNGPIELSGAYNKDSATHVKGDLMGREFEAYRKGDKLVMKDQEGNWQSSAQGGGRGGPGGGMMGRLVKAPHEELADFEKKFKSIKKGDKKTIDGKECFSYEGDLTEEGIKEMLPMGGRMQGMGDSEFTGSAKLWIDGDDIIRRYEVVTNMSLNFQGNQIDMKISRSIDLTSIDETKVEVPKEVQDLLDKKEESKEKENP